MHQNGQTHFQPRSQLGTRVTQFKDFAASAARFLKNVWLFYDIMHLKAHSKVWNNF